MAKRSKKYIKIREKRETGTVSLEEAVKAAKKLSYSTFPGSLELHIALNLPKDTDPKSVKGSVSLPHSAGKTNRVAVFTSAGNVEAAKKAGADIVGLEDLMKEVQAGKVEFDVAIATPDVMPQIAVLGKQLGPKGLMPNPKTGTVTEDLENTIQEYKKGKMNFIADEQGGVHMGVGKIELEDAKIIENIEVALKAITAAVGKPVVNIGRKFALAPSMGPSVKFTYTTDETA